MTVHRILDWAPKAIVFDCDGTLVDTERHWVEARELVLRDHRVTPDAAFAESAKGLHYTECGVLMARIAERPDLTEEMTRQLLERFRSLVAQDPAATPGARELVTAAARSVPLAVASNCPLDVVEFCLESIGLRRRFQHVVVPAEGIAPKPHPDVYAIAAQRLGADPADTLAVEDSYCGLQAAHRAGLRTLGVGRQPGQDAVDLADLWVDTLDDARVTAWAARWTDEPVPVGRPPSGSRPVPPPSGPSPEEIRTVTGHSAASSLPGRPGSTS
ncbi:HAD family hydrolase [Streptomyces palmae]|uniref:HAD family phosphatase n=1 Tax=Streptomyces palmae TaxID=1701085 RepID=A0A4Z0HIQ6_9ACTN|nr:HAD family phosphatase [Streptomyces palmae]TGB18046.1 HAD family phosphatase [Streptomyces palmae]